MKIKLSTEQIILFLLWALSLLSLLYAIFNYYIPAIPDILGLVTLIIVTILTYKRSKFHRWAMLFMLVLFTLNLIAFTFTLSTTFAVGFSPQLQFIPFLLLTVYVGKRRGRIWHHLTFVFGNSKFDRERESIAQKDWFKDSFQKLTDDELSAKLEEDLTDEALQACQEIIEERKNVQKQQAIRNGR